MPRLERRYLFGAERHQIQAQIDGDHLRLDLDGDSHDFTMVPGSSGAFVLRHGDRVLTGYAVATGQAVWVQFEGQTWVLDVEKPARPGSAGAPAGGLITSPMTGTVRKVMAEGGRFVAQGTPLIIVEAMKMEYSVTAPADGTVRKVLCEAGQSVDLGQLLAEFEAKKDDAPKSGEAAAP